MSSEGGSAAAAGSSEGDSTFERLLPSLSPLRGFCHAGGRVLPRRRNGSTTSASFHSFEAGSTTAVSSEGGSAAAAPSEESSAVAARFDTK